MKYNFLYSLESNNIEQVKDEYIIKDLYYLRSTLPSEEQLMNYNKNPSLTSAVQKYGSVKVIGKIKKYISGLDYNIPLFDIYGENIYIIEKINVYHRVIRNNYRFPDRQILDYIRTRKIEMTNKISKLKNGNMDIIIYERHLYKYNIAIEFMENFDIDILYATYIRLYYLYSDPVSTDLTVCARPSFTSNFRHVRPYYSKNELYNLALNMGFVTEQELSSQSLDIKDICSKVKDNDITSRTLMKHQKYMIDNHKVGLVQYYTLHGSFFINRYLRNSVNYKYKNLELEHIAKEMYDLTVNSPSFDKDYILYRYIFDDSYLNHLKIGDIFVEPGFMSTTRDPFYRNDTHNFGYILLEIKIPKNIVGVGLCVETLSHFDYEQEIILTPRSKIKLTNKISKHKYYHSITRDTFQSQVKIKYEFEYVGREEFVLPLRPEYTDQNLVDFVQIGRKLDNHRTLDEKIEVFVKTILDPMEQCSTKIGKKTYSIMTEKFDSTGAYSKYYAIKSDRGFSLYSIYNNTILFFLEIGTVGGVYVMHVDFCQKYSVLNRKNIMSDSDFITFVSSVAYAFSITKVYVYSEYLSCDFIDKGIENISGNNMKRSNRNRFRSYSSEKFDKLDISNSPVVKNDLSDTVLIENEDEDKLYGGIYSADLFEYIYKGNKRYSFSDIAEKELTPQYSYYFLDKLKTAKPSIILNKSDLDELYQIYVKLYKTDDLAPEKDNIRDFYVWIIFNKCHMINILVEKLNKFYRTNNPFEYDYYVLDPYTFLYNRNIIDIVPVAVNNIKFNLKRNINVQSLNRDVVRLK